MAILKEKFNWKLWVIILLLTFYTVCMIGANYDACLLMANKIKMYNDLLASGVQPDSYSSLNDLIVDLLSKMTHDMRGAILFFYIILAWAKDNLQIRFAAWYWTFLFFAIIFETAIVLHLNDTVFMPVTLVIANYIGAILLLIYITLFALSRVKDISQSIDTNSSYPGVYKPLLTVGSIFLMLIAFGYAIFFFDDALIAHRDNLALMLPFGLISLLLIACLPWFACHYRYIFYDDQPKENKSLL